jgi:hypothetical protein
MREFLLVSCPVLIWVISALQTLFTALTFRAFSKTRSILYLLAGLVGLGLFYDALIISLGSVLQPGPLFTGLSRFRFVAHGALIPLLFPFCAYALDFRKPWKILVWVFTCILVILGTAEGIATELTMQQVAGVTRYTSGNGTPGWAQAVSGILSYGTVVPLILAGIVAWIRQKTPHLFLSGFLMFLFSALGPATGNFDLIFFISMFGEVCMMLFFLLYAARKAAADASRAS